MLDIKDREGCIPKAEMKIRFEQAVASTPVLRDRLLMGTITVNDEFSHYSDPDTDNIWLGFALGMRCAERLQKAAAEAVRG
jgi:hypothetical protein